MYDATRRERRKINEMKTESDGNEFRVLALQKWTTWSALMRFNGVENFEREVGDLFDAWSYEKDANSSLKVTLLVYGSKLND